MWENVSTQSFHSPSEPEPLCTPAAETFLVISTWFSEVLHTYAHYVWGRRPGLRPFGGAKALLVCDLDLISPYIVFIRFLIWISERVDCFENSKFRLIFKAAIFFFINTTVRVFSNPFYKYKYTSSLLSSTWMCHVFLVVTVIRFSSAEYIQRSQTVKSIKMGAAMDKISSHIPIIQSR